MVKEVACTIVQSKNEAGWRRREPFWMDSFRNVGGSGGIHCPALAGRAHSSRMQQECESLRDFRSAEREKKLPRVREPPRVRGSPRVRVAAGVPEMLSGRGSLPERTTQSLAHGIRSQFQFMVEEYGLEGIGELMPLMVNIREKQDSALADNQLIRSFHGKIESIKESAAIKITRG